jgi:hypothetical protein
VVREESGRDLSRIRTEENGVAFVILCGNVVAVSAEGWDIINSAETPREYVSFLMWRL